MTLSAGESNVGDVHSEVVVDDLTRTQIVQYAGASGDYNPLHTDEIFATRVAGFPSIFAHGMLTMGLTGKMVTNYVGDGRLRSFGGRFRAQVWPGDTLTARAEVVDIRNDDEAAAVIELRISTTNQDGVEVFAGEAIAAVG
jgi:acyl dehydratase